MVALGFCINIKMSWGVARLGLCSVEKGHGLGFCGTEEEVGLCLD